MSQEKKINESLLRKSEEEEDCELIGIATTIQSLEKANKVWAQTHHSLRLSKRYKHDKQLSWRLRLGNTLDSTLAHVILIILLVSDIVATTIHILQSLYELSNDLAQCIALLDSCQCTSNFEPSESSNILHIFSISILSTMLIHVFGLFLSFGFTFFKHPGYVIDLVILPITLVLEIFETEGAVLLTILNMWRIVMLAHGVLEMTEEALVKEINKAENQLKGLQKVVSSNSMHDHHEIITKIT